jgi:hypothetical protein
MAFLDFVHVGNNLLVGQRQKIADTVAVVNYAHLAFLLDGERAAPPFLPPKEVNYGGHGGGLEGLQLKF